MLSKAMHITLFRALKSIKVDDDAATAVVGDIERHVESVVNNNIVRVEGELAALRGEVRGELRGVRAGIDALKHQMIVITVLISVVGLAIAAGPIVAKFIH